MSSCPLLSSPCEKTNSYSGTFTDPQCIASCTYNRRDPSNRPGGCDNYMRSYCNQYIGEKTENIPI